MEGRFTIFVLKITAKRVREKNTRKSFLIKVTVKFTSRDLGSGSGSASAIRQNADPDPARIKSMRIRNPE